MKIRGKSDKTARLISVLCALVTWHFFTIKRMVALFLVLFFEKRHVWLSIAMPNFFIIFISLIFYVFLSLIKPTKETGVDWDWVKDWFVFVIGMPAAFIIFLNAIVV